MSSRSKVLLAPALLLATSFLATDARAWQPGVINAGSVRLRPGIGQLIPQREQPIIADPGPLQPAVRPMIPLPGLPDRIRIPSPNDRNNPPSIVLDPDLLRPRERPLVPLPRRRDDGIVPNGNGGAAGPNPAPGPAGNGGVGAPGPAPAPPAQHGGLTPQEIADLVKAALGAIGAPPAGRGGNAPQHGGHGHVAPGPRVGPVPPGGRVNPQPPVNPLRRLSDVSLAYTGSPNSPGVFSRDWYAQYPNVWRPSGAHSRPGGFSTSLRGMSRWLGIHAWRAGEEPTPNVAAAVRLVETGYVDLNPTAQWMPLGVFALRPAGDWGSTRLLYVGATPDGLLRGTYYDLVSDEPADVIGAIDRTNARVAWTVGANPWIVFETSLTQLTRADGQISVHLGSGQSGVWGLSRFDE